MAKKAPKNSVCPDCGAPMVRIVYGYPSPELFGQSARGEVALGGCVISGFGDDPTHRCQQGHEWCWDGTWVRPGAVWEQLISEFRERLDEGNPVDEQPPT